MNERTKLSNRSGMALALAGPFAMGAVLGFPSGPMRMISEGLLLPAVVFGVTAVMAPALYIGLSLVRVSPPAHDVARAFSDGLRACGVVLAGLAPATAFLLATADASWAVGVFGMVSVGAATLLGVRRLFAQLRRGDVNLLRALPLFAGWALVSLGLGVHFFVQTLRV